MKNLLKLYEQATPNHIREGKRWYLDARIFCNDLACEVNQIIGDTVYTKRDMAVLVAILSPACSWEQNKRDASNLAIAYAAGFAERIKVCTYGQFKQKAIDWLAGRVEWKETRTNKKTFCFADNISNPQSKRVTIDRHAFKAYHGLAGKGSRQFTPKQYELAEKGYTRAAKAVGLSPMQFQAIVWLVIREQ